MTNLIKPVMFWGSHLNKIVGDGEVVAAVAEGGLVGPDQVARLGVGADCPHVVGVPGDSKGWLFLLDFRFPE